jgi:hypothetical protein
MIRRAVLGVVLLLSACDLEPPNGKLVCGLSDPSCPRGTYCAFDRHCWNDGTGPDRGLAAGAACEFGDSCATGFCSDGVCCDTACDQLCSTCKRPDKFGTCSVVTDGQPSPEGHPQCDAPELCFAGSCSLSSLGFPCEKDNDCGSGVCGDGVCCEQRCGECAVCNAPGQEGTCQNVPAGEDPRGDCFAAGGDAECSTTCDGEGACAIPVSPCGERCIEEPARFSPAFQPAITEVRRFACSLARRCEVVIETTSCGSNGCQGPTQGCVDQCVDEWSCAKGYNCFEYETVNMTPARACIDMANPSGSTAAAECTKDVECMSGFCDPVTLHCRDCVTSNECPTGKGCTPEGRCSSLLKCPSFDCAAAGQGDTCVSGFCTASSPAACTDPHRPGFTGVTCACGTVNGLGFACGHDEVCSSTDLNTSRCVGVAGRPCYADVACASGKCVDHVCGKAPSGTLCLSSADCESGICAANGSGRQVCN